MRRLPAILLLVAFAALGSGLLEGLHLRTHLRERAVAAAALGVVSPSAGQSAPEPGDGACELCAHLHLPQVSGGWVPVLVCLGLFVAYLTQLAPRLAPQRVAARLDCRGPPAL